jgi:tetratricopeptide (TPR) repeat protein
MIASPAADPFQFDYRRHLAAQDLLPQHQEDFQRLVKLLRFAPRFQLLFARIADESYRGLLIGKLQDLLASAGRPVHTADLADDERFPDFEALETWLAALGQGQAVIHLVNTGHWLQGPRLQSLNVRRDALAKRLDAALLWWLPPAALERVAREAPDAWSWRAGVFDFVAAVPEQRMGLANRPKVSLDIGPLTLAQRSRRLAVLHQQLDGEEAAAIPDDLRLLLLIEQGDVYESLGQWDLAQRVLREGALPLAERLGDVRAKAVTQSKIADILEARGELDAALRIHTEEELPVFERLGDMRAKAVTQGKIADILQARGELDAALRIRTEEELPVFERLGAVREKTVTQGRIADILEARGELDAALALHDQRLPIAQQMGDIHIIAHIKYSMAQIRLQRGDLQTGGFQQIHDDLAESFEIMRKLGRPDGIGAVGQLLAQVLAMRGEKGEALEVLDQAESAYVKLADDQGVARVRSLREAIAAGT